MDKALAEMASPMDAYYDSSDTPSERNSLDGRHMYHQHLHQNHDHDDFDFPVPPAPVSAPRPRTARSPPPQSAVSPPPRPRTALSPGPRPTVSSPNPTSHPAVRPRLEDRDRSRSRGASGERQRTSEVFFAEKSPTSDTAPAAPTPKTFYRESLPPRYVPALLEALNDETLQPPLTPTPPPVRPGHDGSSTTATSLGGRRCGCAGHDRKTLWVLVAILTLAVIGIGVGVGVGIGIGQKNLAAASANDTSSEPTSTMSGGQTTTVSLFLTSTPGGGTPTTITSATSVVVPTHSATATSPNSTPPDCPSVNDTTYAAANGKHFRRLCGIDFSGPGSATDIGRVNTGSMTDCIDICAGFYGCSGCSWGPASGDPPGQHGCFLKASLVEAHGAADDWQFAELI